MKKIIERSTVVNHYRLIIGLIVLVILCGSTGTVVFGLYKEKISQPKPLANTGLIATCTDGKAVELVKPNVVRIENKTQSGSVVGTGFFEPNGYLVTNSHIVDEKGEITVYYPNSESSKATLVSNDITKDIALLTVEKSGVKTLIWGNTEELNEPDTLLAVGYALNLPGETSVTKGALSARRSFEGVHYLQTDAPLNQGNSGGPLINTCGQVVGINSMLSDNASINLAITSESAQKIILALTENKVVNYNNGKERATIVSNLLNIAGLKEEKEDEEVAVPQPAKQEENKASQPAQNTARRSNSNSAANSTPSNNSRPSANTNAQPTESDKSVPVAPATLVCNIQANPQEVEVGEKTLITLSGNLDGSTTSWTGGGVFSDIDNPQFRASWSHSQPGDYELTGTVVKGNSQCQKTVRVKVLSPVTKVNNLANIILFNLLSPVYSEQLKKDAYEVGIGYVNSNRVDISWNQPRSAYMPISASVEIYQQDWQGSPDKKLVYKRNFSNSEIQVSRPYRMIHVPIDQINLAEEDYNPDTNQAMCLVKVTVTTPEQGIFTVENYGSIPKH